MSRQHPSPVPKVYCSFVHKNRAYIVMERIDGEEIPKAWSKLNEASRQSVKAQLKEMVDELRALPLPPDTGVESCVGGSLHDSRMARSSLRFGPFKTSQEFHRWLREDVQLYELTDQARDEDGQGTEDMVTKQDGPWPPPIFTHGDLNPFDILVRDGRVVAIIDWEFSG